MLDSIKEAKEWGMRPLALVSFEQPSESWQTLDFLLVKAYEQIQAFKCPICGGWIWECSSEIAKTARIDFNIKEVHCRKTVQIEQYENSKLPANEKTTERHRMRKWGLWHKTNAEIPKQFANLDGYVMPTIEDMLSQKEK